jgi:hypothetical protein
MITSLVRPNHTLPYTLYNLDQNIGKKRKMAGIYELVFRAWNQDIAGKSNLIWKRITGNSYILKSVIFVIFEKKNQMPGEVKFRGPYCLISLSEYYF